MDVLMYQRGLNFPAEDPQPPQHRPVGVWDGTLEAREQNITTDWLKYVEMYL